MSDKPNPMSEKPQTTAETARKLRLACSVCHGSFFSPVWQMRCPACVEACAKMMSLPDNPTQTTTVPTQKQVEALADAMSSMLDDMGKDTQSVCLYTKAKARIAYEPFMAMMEDGPEFYMPLVEAERIVKECDDGR